MTGMRSNWPMSVSRPGLILTGSPTKPRSRILSMFESGSRRRRLSFRASMSRPSLPESPIAVPPWALIAVTICLLMRPERTISTISTVSRSVTRRPSTKELLILRRSSMAPICGPPPCTTTGLMPTCLISTTSRANVSANSLSPMAWPPYLMTKVLPLCRRIYGRASESVRATSCISAVAPGRFLLMVPGL